MVALKNYPDIDQKNTGRNGMQNCVPTSIADGIEYLTGQAIDVAAMVAAVYGPSYVGFTSAAMFVGTAAQYGVKLWAIDGDGPTLVQAVHEQIIAGHPCIATEPDPWAANHPDWSHVISFYREDTGSLTARDPYSVSDVTHPDSEWAKLFEFNQVWAMELENDMAITIQSPGVATYFVETAPDRWHCKQTGFDVAYAMLAYYKATNGLETLGLPKSNEVPIELVNPPLFAKDAGHGITVQYYERGTLVYDEAHLLDNPPGSGSVYRAHLYSQNAVGLDPRLWTANLSKLVQAAK